MVCRFTGEAVAGVRVVTGFETGFWCSGIRDSDGDICPEFCVVEVFSKKKVKKIETPAENSN